jgi:hypothetical protein
VCISSSGSLVSKACIGALLGGVSLTENKKNGRPKVQQL